MAAPKTDDEIRAKTRELMQGVGLCMFTTVDEQGRMRARPMALMGLDVDVVEGRVWGPGKGEVLLRHAPSLGPTLANVRNCFFPWPKSAS